MINYRFRQLIPIGEIFWAEERKKELEEEEENEKDKNSGRTKKSRRGEDDNI